MSFLGFVNYHRDHVPNFACLTACLCELSHQQGHLEWKPEHDDSFQQTKQALSTAPCLAYPNPVDKFILDTDASDHAIGEVLSQLQNGREVVLCYACHVLLKPQRKVLHHTQGTFD